MTAQTTAQRQEALRAKREMLGLTEVRGIYLPPAMHQELKKLAEKLSAKFPRHSEEASAKRKLDAE